MKIIKSFRQHSEMTSFKKWYENYSNFHCKNEFCLASFELNNENYKWNCLDCGLMLTSESQAREHFLGKKHQNVLKNKEAFYNSFIDLKTSSINFTKQFSNSSGNVLSESRIQISCSRKNYCKNYTQGKNTFQNIVPPPAGRDNLLETVIKNERRKFSPTDLSIYRTPSGKYYCQSCDLTVNSSAQFLQHSQSRKHKHKASRMCKLK